jgi:cytochrome b
MTTTLTPTPAGHTVTPAPTPGRRVTDAATRTFHWLFAFSFVGAWLTAESERWRLVHVTLGYTLAGLLAFRLLWGLVGPRPVRLSALWRKLAAWPGWLAGLRAGRPDGRQAQNLLMATAVALLLLAVVPLTLSGYATYEEWGGERVGEWLEELHELAANGMLALVLLHLGLIAGLSLLRGSNLARPMLTGCLPGPGPDLLTRRQRITAAFAAAVLAIAVIAFWWLQWVQTLAATQP